MNHYRRFGFSLIALSSFLWTLTLWGGWTTWQTQPQTLENLTLGNVPPGPVWVTGNLAADRPPFFPGPLAQPVLYGQLNLIADGQTLEDWQAWSKDLVIIHQGQHLPLGINGDRLPWSNPITPLTTSWWPVWQKNSKSLSWEGNTWPLEIRPRKTTFLTKRLLTGIPVVVTGQWQKQEKGGAFQPGSVKIFWGDWLRWKANRYRLVFLGVMVSLVTDGFALSFLLKRRGKEPDPIPPQETEEPQQT